MNETCTAECLAARDQFPVGARVLCRDGVPGTVIEMARDVYTADDLGNNRWLAVEVCVRRDDREYYTWYNVNALIAAGA